MVTGLRSIRALSRDTLRGLKPGPIGSKKPRFDWVDPKTLFIEESYQRDVRERGIRLIRSIYSQFDWSRFKPPVCVIMQEFGNVLVCIDGQHTAIAAASHPWLDKIPVMIVEGVNDIERAKAFVGHNRDRLGLTQLAIFRAELVAGDYVAGLVDEACRAAGCQILGGAVDLRKPTAVGATIATGTLKTIAKRHGAPLLARTLAILVAAKRGPVKASEIGAVARILAAAPKRDGLDDALIKVVASKTTEAWAAIGAVQAAESREHLDSAIAGVWCRALGIRLSAPKSRTDRQVLLRSPAKAAPRPAEASPAPQPPDPAPKATPAPAAPDSAVKPSDGILRINGIVLDSATGTIVHRDKSAHLHRPEGILVVAALLRVMPAILGFDRLAAKAFGHARDISLLQDLVRDVNPLLRDASLEIRTVPKMGCTLFDLEQA